MLSFSFRYFFSSLIIVIKSSWPISLFINASNILLSMLFHLLLANMTIILCFFFLYLVVFNSFFTIPVKIKITRLKLAFNITPGAPITVANDAIEIIPVVTNKTVNDLSKYSKEAIYLLSLLLINSLFLIFATK